MPFELGLACAIARLGTRSHSFFVLHSRPYRLDRVLSDLKGAITLSTTDGALREVADGLERSHGVRSLYSRSLFEERVIAATTLASARQLI